MSDLIDDLSDPSEADKVTQLQRALAQTTAKLAKAKASKDELVQAVFDAAQSASLSVGKTTVQVPPRDNRKRDAEIAMLHLTDWQGGKRTEDYDSNVMVDRVRRFLTAVGHRTEVQRAHHPVKDGVLLFGGDLLEGVTIFPGQVWQVDSTLFDQMFKVAQLVEETVLWALQTFEHVHVVFEPGNHGRIGSKRDGVPHGDNYDRMIGEIVRQRLVTEKRLTWEMRDSWFQRVVVGNYRAMLIHGDEIKSFGGQTPSYALMRKGNAWSAGGNGGFEFRDIYVGHYHQPMQLTLANGGQIYMTGSTESGNQFAQEFVAATSVPSQRLHFVDPVKGRVTTTHVEWLD